MFRVSGRMFVPRAQANVDEGICMSLTNTTCDDDYGSGFSSNMMQKTISLNDESYLFTSERYQIEYRPSEKTYYFRAIKSLNDRITLHLFYSQIGKETLHSRLVIKSENEFDCMGFKYTEEADDNWLNNCTQIKDQQNDIEYYKCGEKSGTKPEGACTDYFTNNPIQIPLKYPVELQGYKGYKYSETQNQRLKSYWRIEKVKGEALFTTDDSDYIHINTRKNHLEAKAKSVGTLKVKMNFYGQTFTRNVEVTNSTPSDSLNILITKKNATTNLDPSTPIKPLLPNISQVIDQENDTTMSSFVYDITTTNIDPDEVYIESENPLRFAVFALPISFIGIPLTEGSATISATKLDGTTTSTTLTISDSSGS